MAEKAKNESKAEEARAVLAERDKHNAEAMARQNAGHPTPTQEELDRAALGESVEPEPDGSPLQGRTPEETEKLNKDAKPKSSGAPYQTRAATPKPAS